MHVSWFWIKQRPQFLAEQLAVYYKIDVACLEDYNTNRVLKLQDTKDLKFHGFIVVNSRLGNNQIVAYCNFFIKQIQLFFLVKKNKILWFTSPVQFLLAKRFIGKNQIVIYDCMDDHASFFSEKEVKGNVQRLESSLCKRADYIITSARVLKYRLEKSYQPICPIEVVNNGLSSRQLMNRKTDVNIGGKYPELLKVGVKKIIYIGTVSHWFDFKTLGQLLDNHHSCELIIVGPVDCAFDKHERMIFLGSVDHNVIGSIMEISDVLIMPFIVTDLIRAVNPVKAYEYIASGKPVILSSYEETLVFKDYVYLYESAEELNSLFDKIDQGLLTPKMDLLTCVDFAKNNTWENRASQIYNALNLN